MQNAIITGALTLAAAASNQANAEPTSQALTEPTQSGAPHAHHAATAYTTKKLYLDVHEIGKGKVTAKDVANAHKQDLATQAKYGVDFKAYWVDEKAGKVYCLAEAPSAEATHLVHQKAHGLLASKIMEVTADNMNWVPTPGMKLYMDVHHLGAGKVTAKDVANAHQKDLALGAKHNVKYLNYWLDAESGTVMCLSEAPSAEAAIDVHREAHGLIPDAIEEVSEGR